MVLVQSDGERVIGGKNELGVSLAPVLAVSRSSKRCSSATNEPSSPPFAALTLITAMLTGAEHVASYFCAMLCVYMWV